MGQMAGLLKNDEMSKMEAAVPRNVKNPGTAGLVATLSKLDSHAKNILNVALQFDPHHRANMDGLHVLAKKWKDDIQVQREQARVKREQARAQRVNLTGHKRKRHYNERTD